MACNNRLRTKLLYKAKCCKIKLVGNIDVMAWSSKRSKWRWYYMKLKPRMDEEFHPTFYRVRGYLSMLVLMLIHVSKRTPPSQGSRRTNERYCIDILWDCLVGMGEIAWLKMLRLRSICDDLLLQPYTKWFCVISYLHVVHDVRVMTKRHFTIICFYFFSYIVFTGCFKVDDLKERHIISKRCNTLFQKTMAPIILTTKNFLRCRLLPCQLPPWDSRDMSSLISYVNYQRYVPMVQHCYCHANTRGCVIYGMYQGWCQSCLKKGNIMKKIEHAFRNDKNQSIWYTLKKFDMSTITGIPDFETSTTAMGHLPDTQNCVLCMRRECRERIFAYLVRGPWAAASAHIIAAVVGKALPVRRYISHPRDVCGDLRLISLVICMQQYSPSSVFSGVADTNRWNCHFTFHEIKPELSNSISKTIIGTS